MNAQLTFVHALSPLHAGTGQGAGTIDLPIAREKATGLPFLPGSSLKGALRTRSYTQLGRQDSTQIFGDNELDEVNNRASLAQFSDQRLLLLPVRSLAGTFAWVTSPFILRRFARDVADAQPSIALPAIPIVPKDTCFTTNAQAAIMLDVKKQRMVYLEDLDLEATENPEIDKLAQLLAAYIFPDDTDWQQFLIQRFCLVHDDIFAFLSTAGTEITARIKLKEDTKTVQDGGLWYEEALPTETILSGIMLVTPVKQSTLSVQDITNKLKGLTGQTIQLGGKATVGRGLCRVQMIGSEG